MQIGSTSFITMANQVLKTSKETPVGDTKTEDSLPGRPSVRELAASVDPSNMSRNDAAALGDALARSGDIELGTFFLRQSMVLAEHNGRMESATSSDPIMNAKFNMFDSLDEQLSLAKSKGLSTETLEKAIDFLEKFKIYGENPEVNLYT